MLDIDRIINLNSSELNGHTNTHRWTDGLHNRCCGFAAGGFGGLALSRAFECVARGLVENERELSRQVGLEEVVVVATASVRSLALHHQLDGAVHDVRQHVRQR